MLYCKYGKLFLDMQIIFMSGAFQGGMRPFTVFAWNFLWNIPLQARG